MDRTSRLVGRDAELAALEEEWRRSCAGELRCVMVAGDRGAGKTRLIEAYSTHHASATVLTACSRRFSPAASFGVWAEALREPLSQPAAGVVETSGRALHDLGGLLSHVTGVRPSVLWREPPRIRLLHGLGTILTALAARQPLLLFLDDVHLADASSWEALEYMALHFQELAALIVVAAEQRIVVEQSAAMDVVAKLQSRHVLRGVELAPLEATALRQMSEEVLGLPAGDDVAGWVSNRSQGNALKAAGLLFALREDGGAPRPGLRFLPEELSERVRVRMRALDEGARRLLQVLAVADSPLRLDELVDLGECSLEHAAHALRRLIGVRLVTRRAEGRHRVYRVVHPAVGDIIYDGISGARLTVLHRNVGRRILVAGHLGEAAMHFARSADIGDGEAIEVLVQALRQAEEWGSVGEARKMVEGLVAILPSDDERWFRVTSSMRGVVRSITG